MENNLPLEKLVTMLKESKIDLRIYKNSRCDDGDQAYDNQRLISYCESRIEDIENLIESYSNKG